MLTWTYPVLRCSPVALGESGPRTTPYTGKPVKIMRKTVVAATVVALAAGGFIAERPDRAESHPCGNEAAAHVRVLRAIGIAERPPVPSPALPCAPGRSGPAPAP